MSLSGLIAECKNTDKLPQLQPHKQVEALKIFIGLVNYFGQTLPNYGAKNRGVSELPKKLSI